MSDQNLSQHAAQWQQNILNPLIQKVGERKNSFVTASGIPQERLYLPQEGQLSPEGSQDYMERLGFPGQPPYTRGIQPTMYRGRFWTMRQYAGFQSAAESNARYRYLLSQGQMGLSVAFDLPTQIGYDPDHPLARGEVGRVGVPISTLEDMKVLLEGIPLEKVSVSMTINSTAIILLAFMVAIADDRGIPRDKLRGTVQNDILKEYVARGTYRFPPKQSLRLVTDLFEFCGHELPRWNTISISGYHIREAGATAAQELAFTFANAIAYVEGAVKKGLDVNQFARRLSFFWNGHNNFLEEIAKFRAARRMWNKILLERFGCKDDKARRMRFHTQTAGSTLTSLQPELNVVRVTLQALAAVLGGTQSLHTNAWDEALGLPTQQTAKIALRTQQIIANESGVANSIDPLGGSYLIESMTDALEQKAFKLIETIDGMGGVLNAIEEGFIQGQIEQSAYEAQKRIESLEDIVVGVNQFRETDSQAPIEGQAINPAAEKERVEAIKAFRLRRDPKEANALLDTLSAKAAGDTNLFNPILECVKGGCTLGEIANILADAFGEYQGADF